MRTASNASVALDHIEFIYRTWSTELRPALHTLGSPLAVNLEDHIKAAGAITSGLSSALNKQKKNGMIH